MTETTITVESIGQRVSTWRVEAAIATIGRRRGAPTPNQFRYVLAARRPAQAGVNYRVGLVVRSDETG